jgi:hypothetical protein
MRKESARTEMAKMLKNPRSLTILLLSLLAMSTFAASFQFTKAESSSTFFSDHFEGSTVDPSKWIVQENANMSGLPAWGGQVAVVNSSICLSSNGTSFPYVHTVSNPFPSSGDFAIQFNMTYTCIGDLGCGLMISNGTPTLESSGAFGSWLFPSDTWHNRIFTLWAGDKSPTLSTIYIELFNSVVWEMDVSGFKPSTSSHLYKLAYSQGVYHVFVDGVEVASEVSLVLPNTITLGHAPVYYIPIANATDWGWCQFKVDYIAMLRSSKISLAAGTQTPQLGDKVNIKGAISGSNNEPLSGQIVDLLYSIPGISTWYPLAAATTDSFGGFSTNWIPTANGEFSLKAQWNGNEEYVGASIVENVSILNDSNDVSFLAESNSTLSSLYFNSTSREISFTVSGPSGTSGYVRFVIPKTLLGNETDFKVYMDGQEVNYTISSFGDQQVLYFEYHHSTHVVDIRVPSLMVPEFPVWVLFPLVLFIALIALVLKKGLACSRTLAPGLSR